MFILSFIRSLYKALSADSSPSAIAFAACFGVIAGAVPLWAGLFFLMLLCILVFRVQITTAILTWGLMRLASLAGLAGVFERVGVNLLENDALRGFWTWFLNLPVIAWLDLHRYAVLGGAAVGLAIALVIFFPIRQLVVGYRRYVHEKVSQNRFFRWLTSFWLVKLLKLIFVGARV
jgi:uncharacterized protein (TIGR03546 family)